MIDLSKTTKITDGNNEFTIKVNAPSAIDIYRLIDCTSSDDYSSKMMRIMLNYTFIMAGDKEMENLTMEKLDNYFQNKKNIIEIYKFVQEYVKLFFA